MRSGVIWTIVGLVAAASCATQPAGPNLLANETMIEPTADVPFQLRAGQIAALHGGIMLAFRRVSNDTRCPSDVQCAWSGDATDFAAGRSAWSARSLHTHVEPRVVVVDAHPIELTNLAPRPVPTRSISPGEYLATFEVKRER